MATPPQLYRQGSGRLQPVAWRSTPDASPQPFSGRGSTPGTPSFLIAGSPPHGGGVINNSSIQTDDWAKEAEDIAALTDESVYRRREDADPRDVDGRDAPLLSRFRKSDLGGGGGGGVTRAAGRACSPCPCLGLLGSLLGAVAFAVGAFVTYHGHTGLDAGGCCMPAACHAPHTAVAWQAANGNSLAVQATADGLCLFSPTAAALLGCPTFALLANETSAAPVCTLVDPHGACLQSPDDVAADVAAIATMTLATLLALLALACVLPGLLCPSRHVYATDDDSARIASWEVPPDGDAVLARGAARGDAVDSGVFRPPFPRLTAMLLGATALVAAFVAAADGLLLRHVLSVATFRDPVASTCVGGHHGGDCVDLEFPTLANCSSSVAVAGHMRRLSWTLHAPWELRAPLAAQAAAAAVTACGAAVALCASAGRWWRRPPQIP